LATFLKKFSQFLFSFFYDLLGTLSKYNFQPLFIIWSTFSGLISYGLEIISIAVL